MTFDKLLLLFLYEKQNPVHQKFRIDSCILKEEETELETKVACGSGSWRIKNVVHGNDGSEKVALVSERQG